MWAKALHFWLLSIEDIAKYCFLVITNSVIQVYAYRIIRLLLTKYLCSSTRVKYKSCMGNLSFNKLTKPGWKADVYKCLVFITSKKITVLFLGMKCSFHGMYLIYSILELKGKLLNLVSRFIPQIMHIVLVVWSPIPQFMLS